MREYELVHEIQNLCRNNQMRDIFFEEVSCEDPVMFLRSRLDGHNLELAVDEDPAECFTGDKYVTVFGPVNAGWKTADVTKSGVIGAPTYATEEKGHKLFDYACEKLLDIFAEIADISY